MGLQAVSAKKNKYFLFLHLVSDDDLDRLEVVKENDEKEVNKNQFYSTERGTQTKVFKYSDQFMQTDPLPM